MDSFEYLESLQPIVEDDEKRHLQKVKLLCGYVKIDDDIQKTKSLDGCRNRMPIQWDPTYDNSIVECKQCKQAEKPSSWEFAKTQYPDHNLFLIVDGIKVDSKDSEDFLVFVKAMCMLDQFRDDASRNLEGAYISKDLKNDQKGFYDCILFIGETTNVYWLRWMLHCYFPEFGYAIMNMKDDKDLRQMRTQCESSDYHLLGNDNFQDWVGLKTNDYEAYQYKHPEEGITFTELLNKDMTEAESKTLDKWKKSKTVTSMHDKDAKKALPPERKYEQRHSLIRNQDYNHTAAKERNNSLLQACYKTARGFLNNVGYDGEIVWHTVEVGYLFEDDDFDQSDYQEDYDIEESVKYLKVDGKTRREYPDYFQSLHKDGEFVKNKGRKISYKKAYQKFIEKFPDQEDNIKEEDPMVMFKMLEVAAQYFLHKYRANTGRPTFMISFEPSCQLLNGENIPHMVLLSVERRMDGDNKPELQAADWVDCGCRYKSFSRHGVSKSRQTVDKCYGLLVLIIIYIYKCGFRYKVLWLAWLARNGIAHTSLFVLAVDTGNFRCSRRYFRDYIPRALINHLQSTQECANSQRTAYDFSQGTDGVPESDPGDAKDRTDNKKTQKFQKLKKEKKTKKKAKKKKERASKQQEQQHDQQQQRSANSNVARAPAQQSATEGFIRSFSGVNVQTILQKRLHQQQQQQQQQGKNRKKKRDLQQPQEEEEAKKKKPKRDRISMRNKMRLQREEEEDRAVNREDEDKAVNREDEEGSRNSDSESDDGRKASAECRI